MGALADGADREMVRQQLNRLLGSSDFDASERNRQFLAFAVEETLEGRGERIKAYAVATSAFGRGEDFDPQQDAIVRVEAGRLRQSLERYYLKAGNSDPIRISMPRGSYAVAFDLQEGREPQSLPAVNAEAISERVDRLGPSILVAPFEEEGDHTALPSLARGLARHIIVALTRFSDLRVFGSQSSHRPPGIGPEPDGELKVDFLLTGGTMISNGRIYVDALLLDARDGRNLWAGAYERDLLTENIAAVRDELADSIARTLGQPYGVIFSNLVKETSATIPEEPSSYDLVIKGLEYEQSLAAELFEPAREGLERVVASEPRYAAALAILSRLYTDAHRFDYDVSDVTDAPLRRALELARRALRLEPESSAAHLALGMALWSAGDTDGALEELDLSGALNPNDTEVMAERGYRYALLADWDKAVPLLRESFALSPAQPSTYRMGLALYHFAKGEFDRALAEARKIEAQTLIGVQAFIAAAAGRAGLSSEAEAAVKSILTIDPNYGARATSFLESRGLHPELNRQIIEGLRLAGMPIAA